MGFGYWSHFAFPRESTNIVYSLLFHENRMVMLTFDHCPLFSCVDVRSAVAGNSGVCCSGRFPAFLATVGVVMGVWGQCPGPQSGNASHLGHLIGGPTSHATQEHHCAGAYTLSVLHAYTPSPVCLGVHSTVTLILIMFLVLFPAWSHFV